MICERCKLEYAEHEHVVTVANDEVGIVRSIDLCQPCVNALIAWIDAGPTTETAA